jgi:hypothetical protein
VLIPAILDIRQEKRPAEVSPITSAGHSKGKQERPVVLTAKQNFPSSFLPWGQILTALGRLVYLLFLFLFAALLCPTYSELAAFDPGDGFKAENVF